MFTTIHVTISKDSSGGRFVSIRRYDNHRKVAGSGRLYRSGNTGRIYSAIRSLGFHFMHPTGNGAVYGKFIG